MWLHSRCLSPKQRLEKTKKSYATCSWKCFHKHYKEKSLCSLIRQLESRSIMNGPRNWTTNSIECNESWARWPKTDQILPKQKERTNRRNQITTPDILPLPEKTQMQWTSMLYPLSNMMNTLRKDSALDAEDKDTLTRIVHSNLDGTNGQQ